MEQEQINIEDIMQEIRAEIRAKGYADNEIPFSDIACLVGGTEVPFDLKDYLDDISMMDESRTVLAQIIRAWHTIYEIIQLGEINMRLRNVPGAREVMVENEYVLQNRKA